jgi:hypothetical protein
VQRSTDCSILISSLIHGSGELLNVATPAAAGALPLEHIKLNAIEAQWVVTLVLQHLPLFDATVQFSWR